MPTGLPDFWKKIAISGQYVPLIPRREWSSEFVQDIYFTFRGTVDAGTTTIVIQYTVPSGKTLYITDVAFWGKDRGIVWIITANLGWIFGFADIGYGFAVAPLSIPIRIASGDVVTLRITNDTAANVYYELFVHGYLI